MKTTIINARLASVSYSSASGIAKFTYVADLTRHEEVQKLRREIETLKKELADRVKGKLMEVQPLINVFLGREPIGSPKFSISAIEKKDGTTIVYIKHGLLSPAKPLEVSEASFMKLWRAAIERLERLKQELEKKIRETEQRIEELRKRAEVLRKRGGLTSLFKRFATSTKISFEERELESLRKQLERVKSLLKEIKSDKYAERAKSVASSIIGIVKQFVQKISEKEAELEDLISMLKEIALENVQGAIPLGNGIYAYLIQRAAKDHKLEFVYSTKMHVPEQVTEYESYLRHLAPSRISIIGSLKPIEKKEIELTPPYKIRIAV